MGAGQQPAKRMKGMRIATRFATLDQFVAQFRRFCDERSVFVCTLATRPAGLETAFSIDLADGTPALRGIGRVLDTSPTDAKQFGRPGLRLGIRRLTADTEHVFARLRAPEAGAPEVEADGAETDVHAAPANESLPPGENRTPGGELVLPANPLAGIGDRSLEGFVDCTLYEETGNFFPVEPSPDEPAEPTTPPPDLVPIARRPTPVPLPAVPAPSPTPEPPVPVQVSVPTPAPRPPSPTPEPAQAQAPIVTPMPQEPVERAASQPAIELAPEEVMWTPPAPPPPPRMAPPAVPALARSSQPVIDEPPIGARRLPGWAKLHELPRAWLFAAAGALAVIVIVVIATSGSRQTGAKKPAPPPPAPPVASRPAPPPTPAPAPEPTEPDETASGGTPVVGKGPCRFSVTTTPAGSIVQVDGDTVGPSPIVVAGPCQKRQLTISHQRYQSQTRAVALVADKPQSLEVILQRPVHHLMIETVPNGAIVSIAGHRAGTSPTNVDIMGFQTVEVVITKPGYKPVSRQVYSKVPNDHLAAKLTR